MSKANNKNVADFNDTPLRMLLPINRYLPTEWRHNKYIHSKKNLPFLILSQISEARIYNNSELLLDANPH